MAITQEGKLEIILGAEGDVLTRKVFLRYVRWVGGTTAGHTCVLRDGGGTVFFESIADGNYFIDVHPLFRWVNGVTADTLGSGKVYLYIF